MSEKRQHCRAATARGALLGFAVAAAAAAGACRQSADAQSTEASQAVLVVCDTAHAGAVENRVALQGVVGVPPDRDAVVAPRVAGRISAMRVHEGDAVKKGDLLATVEDPSLATDIAQADAAMKTAQATEANATQALARAKRLFGEGIAAKREVENAQAREATTDAALSAARSQQKLAHAREAHARVRAPISGLVVHVLRRRGELVDGTPQTPIVDIADPSVLEMHADVPAPVLVHLAVGMPVTVELDALPGVNIHGKIVALSPAVDPKTSLGEVRAALTPPPKSVGTLRIGLSGKLKIKLHGGGRTPVVPLAALRRSADGHDQVVVCAPGPKGGRVAKVRAVTTGARADGKVAITSGLKAGEQVVTSHVLGLEDGTPLASKKSSGGT